LKLSKCRRIGIHRSQQGKGLNANWEEVQILIAYPRSEFAFCFWQKKWKMP